MPPASFPIDHDGPASAAARPAVPWAPVPHGDACADDSAPGVDASIRRLRLFRLAGALLAAAVRDRLWANAGVQARRRAAVCSAAGILSALGIRVEVVNPVRPWPRPRTGHLVVSNHVSWLDGLALLVAVRATPVAGAHPGGRTLVGGPARRLGVVVVERGRPRWVAPGVEETAARLRRGESVSVHPEGTSTGGAVGGRFHPAVFQAAVDTGAAVCPVAIRYRLDTGAATTVPSRLPGEPGRRSIARVLSARGLVVEVHLLPALDATAADHGALAVRAEDAIATVIRVERPLSGAHPDPARPVPDAAQQIDSTPRGVARAGRSRHRRGPASEHLGPRPAQSHGQERAPVSPR